MLDTTTRLNGSTSSLNGSMKDATTDMKSLVKDAQALLTAAAALSGEKAEEMRGRGMELLDRALGKASQYQGQALVKGKELAHTADVYVKDNPWRTVAVTAGAALLLGVILGRK
ncbi:MAG: YqjD family protein [Massilia sp.]